jgi:hypothetical protein
MLSIKNHYLVIVNKDVLIDMIIINFSRNRWNPYCLVVNIFRLLLRTESGFIVALGKSQKSCVSSFAHKPRLNGLCYCCREVPC